MTCLDDDTVLGLVEGRLAAPVLANVDEHLDGCETCRDVVAHIAQMSTPSQVLERGHTIGRYVIGELLGAGAMGRVYSAWDPELDRRVALKLLVAEGDDARSRVVREAQAMARLDHPNVVGVHEVGTAADGVYVVMDLVDGEALRAWAAEARPWRDAVPRLLDVARGLAAVHAAGVVHRDIKPDNIIVGVDGRARLGDFGLARTGVGPRTIVPSTGELAVGTPATAVAGTPAYMAPEVLRGGVADAASDQFSFGVLAYEVLAGQRPFRGGSWAELLATIEARGPAPVRGVPGWLDGALRRCLAVTPSDRFGSMAELVDHLARRAVRPSRARWVAGVGVVAVVAGVATWFGVREATSLGSAPSAASCAVGAAELAMVWSPDIRARLVGLGVPALRALDGWSQRWTNERDATCRATEYEPAPRTAARVRCLEHRRAELAALLARLELAPSGDRVADALAVLPPASECQLADPGMALPPPLDPALASIVDEVVAGLPAVRAAVALGDARPVLATTAKLVERARASGHQPTLAEALLVRAEALRGASALPDAALAARDAVVAADRGHADLLAARAWIARVATAGDRRELAAAEDLAAIAIAAVDRAGAPAHLVATLLRLRGLIAYNRGQLAEAKRLLTEAHAQVIAVAGKDSIEISTIESALGSVARAAGELEISLGWHRRALERDRTLRGAAHPDVARDLHNIAGALRLDGKLVEAEATYRQALAIELATRGEDSVEVALTRNSIALVDMARGAWAAAGAELERARVVFDAAGHGDLAFTEHNLGLVAAALGDHARAMDHFARADEIYRATLGDGAAPAIRLHLDRARSELALGHRSEGLAQGRRAQAAAHEAGIAWIEDEATTLLATGRRRPAAPPIAVVAVETPPPTATATPPAAATVVPTPDPPAPLPGPPGKPVKDVGVYGSTQSW